mmetsp:Transcript_21260/g.39146  ORF Transcript_21260/g.39146 Transcript_21260/m.39146 type:complete len:297 (+) Transcript_21260:136-1026(+)
MKNFVQELAELRMQKVERDALLKATRVHIGQCGKLEIIAEDLKLQLELKARQLTSLGGSDASPQDNKRKGLESQLEMLEHEFACLTQLTRETDILGDLKEKLLVLTKLKESQLSKFREVKLRSMPMASTDSELSFISAGLANEVKSLLEANNKLQEKLDALKMRYAVVNRNRNESIAKKLSQEAAIADVQPTVNISICEEIDCKEEPTPSVLSVSQKLIATKSLKAFQGSPEVSYSNQSLTTTPRKLLSRPASQSMLKPKVSSYKPSHLRMTSDRRDLKPQSKPSRVKPVPLSSFR